jgi:DNA-binding response OmpR family regulator
MAEAMPRRRVLIVEDEASLRQSYARFFGARFELAFAASGADALRLAAERAPDVAVLDLRLPDTDGIALLQQLRVAYPGLPIIITTAYVSLEPQLRVLDLAHDGYLVKPFDLAELGARLDATG